MRPYDKIFQKLGKIEKVLDIGCGDGMLDVFLAKKGGIKIVGLDISPDGFGHAKKKSLENGVEDLVSCVKGSVYDMAFAKDKEFDAATLLYSLHHLENPICALKEVRRVIRPGGKVLIMECIPEDEEGIACCTFNKTALVTVLERSGFENVKIETLGSEEGQEFALFTAVK